MATDQQLRLLEKAKTCYIDGTFKQLLTINAFVRSEGCIKQVPLVFVVMSGRKKKDCKAVISSILSLLNQPCVQQITVDFERAMWSALRDVLPNVRLVGCAFHWVQAVWRKVQELGLQQQYFRKGQVHKFLRRLMALPYLFAHEIAGQFFSLKNHRIARESKAR